MSDGASDPFDAEHEAALKQRFVIDRVDGRPLLQGVARCPHCEVKLRTLPRSRMDLGDKAVRIVFELQCPACGRTLTLQEDFDWEE